MEPTLSMKFLLCALDKKGRLNCFDKYVMYGVVTATMIELRDVGAIEIHDKYGDVIGILSDDRPWLKPAYDVLSDTANNPSIGDVARLLYLPLFTDTRARKTLEAYWLPLEQNGIIERKQSKIGPYRHVISNQKYYENLLSDIKNQLFESGPYNLEAITLAFLMKHSQCLTNAIGPTGLLRQRSLFEKFNDESAIDRVLLNEINKNRDVIACVSFATSALGGNFL